MAPGATITSNEILAGSFRDPSGFLFERDQTLYRQVNTVYERHYAHLTASGLYDLLSDRGLLIPHQVVTTEFPHSPEVCQVLRPERVPFISYPYEWCFSQLKDAALSTLNIQDQALDHGMSLKDASAYNIQFHRGRPVLIDSLSFEVYREGQPWVAYRQFCQHFVAPLVLMSQRDVRLSQLLRIHLDGIPLDLASALLPMRSYAKFGILSHIHLHAKSQQRHSAASVAAGGGTMSLRALRGLVENLRSVIADLQYGHHAESTWSSYYTETTYSEQDMQEKLALVQQFLAEANPSTVWDLGANTGRFSEVAARRGCDVVALDSDELSVERHYRACGARAETRILPLVMDVANPSGGIGWAHQERDSLEARGPADVLLALAVVHHLAIVNNVPLEKIARWCAGLGTSLIIEWVPKRDPQVQRLLASRDDVFSSYDKESFEDAFERDFVISQARPIGESGRVLYWMRGRFPGQ